MVSSPAMETRRRHTLQFAGLACAVALLGYTGVFLRAAQSPTDSGQTGSSIQVHTRLVRVNVLVKKKGVPVTGLTKDDFALYDEGHPQEIAHFSEQVFNPAAIKSGASPNTQAKTVFSNQYDPASSVPPSVTIILIDALNTPPAELLNARAQLTVFLRQLQPQDRVALCGLSTKLYVLHDFTTDSSALLASLGKFKDTSVYHESATEVQSLNIGDQLEAFLDAANQQAADFATINRVEVTASALTAIANAVINLPGRKNLVWLSGGFPFRVGMDVTNDDTSSASTPSVQAGGVQPHTPQAINPVAFRDFQKDIQTASEAINNANVAIYPVDASGLAGAPPVFSAAVSGKGATNAPAMMRSMAPNGTAGSTYTVPHENIQSLNELADRTGGVAFHDDNDIKHALRTAVDDSLDSYELDYYPRDVNWDGHFHNLKVEVKKRGVDVRFRCGYVASAETMPDRTRVQQAMQNAMSSPFEDADLPLTINILSSTAQVPGKLSLQVTADPAQLGFKKIGDSWESDVNVAWMQFTADGKLAGGTLQTLHLTFPQSTYDESRTSGAKFTHELTLKDNVVRLRIAMETSTGAVGSVDVPLK
jgi:VWFA-related protein